MLVVKTNPVGIDIPIQAAQKQLHRHIVKALALEDDASIAVYGRVYRNKMDNGYIAEAYVGDNEYKEVYMDDSLSLISFFGISTEVSSKIQNRADVHLIVFGDLSKLNLKDRLGALVVHRADEELRQMAYKGLGKMSYSMTYDGFELGVENVLRDYPGTLRDNRLKHVDMHPFHCFRLNYTLTYDPNKVC